MMGRLFREGSLGKKILVAVVTLTVGFIFTQSLLPQSVSGEESAAVSGWLASIFPVTTPLGGFIAANVRKIAHFVEFGAFGLELALFLILYAENKRKSFVAVLLAGFFTAFIDETLQIFSGRGPSVADVWLDYSGFLTFFALTLAVRLLFKIIEERRKNVG